MPADDRDDFPLAEIIGRLGSELREAELNHRQAGDDDWLEVKECTVELGLTFEKSGEGGIDFKVVKLGRGTRQDQYADDHGHLATHGRRPSVRSAGEPA